MMDSSRNMAFLVTVGTDISERKAHEQELEHIAHYDALTDLPNRLLLAIRLQQAIMQANFTGQSIAVAYLDLDGFKAINDDYGHDAGDYLLVTLAKRMRLALGADNTIARIGGDEFIIILTNADAAERLQVLQRLLIAAAEPVIYKQSLLQVSASLGVTQYPQAVDVDADLLMRQADQAMYQAKLSGKNCYHLFNFDTQLTTS
jgi:diguanylate cyclase (GGDEF)-like protein